MDVAPNNREEFLHTIRSLQQNLEQEDGFRKSCLTEDGSDKSSFQLAIEWETQDDLNNYLRSDVFRILLGALKVLARYSEVQFTSGLRPGDPKMSDHTKNRA